MADLLEQPDTVELEQLPAALRRLAERDQLPAEDVAMLAAIRYRGKQPKSVAAWAFVLEAVRLAILDPAEDVLTCWPAGYRSVIAPCASVVCFDRWADRD